MFTRQDYLNGICTHREFYSQYVNDHILGLTEMSIGLFAIKESRDEHFNDIPLIRWDITSKLIMQYVADKNVDLCGSRSSSLSDCVCVLKEAARQIKEKSNG